MRLYMFNVAVFQLALRGGQETSKIKLDAMYKSCRLYSHLCCFVFVILTII